MKQTITARITFDPSQRLDPENDYDPEVDLVSIMEYGQDRFNVDSYSIVSVDPVSDGKAGGDETDRQFTVVISSQTYAASAKEAVQIALDQIADRSAFVEVKSDDGGHEEDTLSVILDQ
jgi:hypothetical protein